MKNCISLRLRVTLVCGIVLAVCCLLLTLSHNYYAYEMANAIEAIPLQPAQTVGAAQTVPAQEMEKVQTSRPAREAFRTQSLFAMGVIVAGGCWMVYWLTGKALSPLRKLDQQIRTRTAEDLNQPLPVPNSGDEVAGLTVSFNQMSQNLSQVFDQQKRFSQCAAHELRTPLAVVKTRMALFRKKGLCSTPETAQLLDVLEEQVNRLSALVNDLLALTNMEGMDRSELIVLPELLSRVAGSLEGVAQDSRVTLRLQIQPGKTRGNSILLERAFFNLMENAIQYNRQDGTVAVTMAREGDRMRIEITDEGMGIPPEHREKIFEPFFRVEQSRSRHLGGAGLGLPLARSIIQLHQGKILVESTRHQGSKFVVELPLMQ